MFTFLQHSKLNSLIYNLPDETAKINAAADASGLKNERILFFGIILGYKSYQAHELKSVDADKRKWKSLCQQNNVAHKIVTDCTHIVDTVYLKRKMRQMFEYCLDNLTDLCIILLSGHGETDANEDFYFLMDSPLASSTDSKSDTPLLPVKVNLTATLHEILLENKTLINASKLNMLFLFDTCYSANPLKLKYELTKPEVPLSKDNFYNFAHDNLMSTYSVWSVGAGKSLSSLKFAHGEYVSEFTEKIFKLNSFSEASIAQSLLKIKSIHSDCCIFFSKIY